ncbi:hypothetical protein E2C01_070843 [Portunus trituberculatus]|uniref:Uncharacterized protein n=1 Tax=Portunus trituberculatus TaxID=210409 RepID=A0A5B7I2F8_PORTR|nr:hypothetical protein [Portunus trituberculatus]
MNQRLVTRLPVEPRIARAPSSPSTPTHQRHHHHHHHNCNNNLIALLPPPPPLPPPSSPGTIYAGD